MEGQRVTSHAEKYSLPLPYISKMRGAGVSPLKVNVKDAMTALVGGFITISALSMLTGATAT